MRSANMACSYVIHSSFTEKNESIDQRIIWISYICVIVVDSQLERKDYCQREDIGVQVQGSDQLWDLLQNKLVQPKYNRNEGTKKINTNELEQQNEEIKNNNTTY